MVPARLRPFALLALALWLVAGTAIGGALLIKHMVALPTPPASDPALVAALNGLGGRGDWRAIHVMYRACTCSRRTIAHLLAGDRPHVRETVLMVDDDGAAGPEDDRLRAAGMTVVLATPAELHARYHLEAAPLLAVVAPDDTVAYLGGYNRHKQSGAYEDLAIIAELRGRGAVDPLPVFGCATSDRLKSSLSPL